MLLTPYPPGTLRLIPGERFNATIVRYLQFAREFNTQFPGFETDIHGLVKSEGNGYFASIVVTPSQLAGGWAMNPFSRSI